MCGAASTAKNIAVSHTTTVRWGRYTKPPSQRLSLCSSQALTMKNVTIKTAVAVTAASNTLLNKMYPRHVNVS
jgi:hypothetical protein